MIDIVLTAREMGVYTIVADRESSSPAKRFADKAFDLSTNDMDGLTELCKSESIDGVFTGFEDFNIHIACELCSRLGLPFYATREQLDCVTDKHRFKDKCRQHGVPVVEQYGLEEALKREKYPYIVKPTDSYGSRGITVCRTEEQLLRGYDRAIAASASRSAIIERFIDSDHGTELFYTVVNGNIYLTATADRYTVKTGVTTVPLPVAEVFPSRHEREMEQELDLSIRNMLADLNICNGLVLIQALWQDGEFFVYEMAYRLTGEQHYRLVAKQQGINLSVMMISLALGENVSEYNTEKISNKFFVHPSVNYAVVLKPGRIATVRGLERVYKIDEVISYNLTHFDNDVIAASGDYSHMLIRINMVAGDYESLCRAVKDVNSYISVVSDAGEDMVFCRFELPGREV